MPLATQIYADFSTENLQNYKISALNKKICENLRL
jgi:hypothetical protein